MHGDEYSTSWITAKEKERKRKKKTQGEGGWDDTRARRALQVRKESIKHHQDRKHHNLDR
jgi:hypothetical protein